MEINLDYEVAAAKIIRFTGQIQIEYVLARSREVRKIPVGPNIDKYMWVHGNWEFAFGHNGYRYYIRIPPLPTFDTPQ